MQEISETPNRIQMEIGRLQGMCDVISASSPESNSADVLATDIVPTLERWRAVAQKEVDGDGITSATYNALQLQMTLAHNAGWDLYDELPNRNPDARIICEQVDQIHVLMNETGVKNPNPLESHKCFPPGSECD